jgi:type VI secretion system protein ImpF
VSSSAGRPVPSRGGTEGSLTPSVLDRLIDEDPDVRVERPKSRTQQMRDLRASVLRDVTNLLNTRRRVGVDPASVEGLVPSLVDYGIPDLASARFATATGRQQFADQVEALLTRYEPRFRRVKVILARTQDARDGALRFRIDALLHADPAPEPVVFDSVVDLVDGSVQVSGGAA